MKDERLDHTNHQRRAAPPDAEGSLVLAIDAGNTRIKAGLFLLSKEVLTLPGPIAILACEIGVQPDWAQIVSVCNREDGSKPYCPMSAVIAGSNPPVRDVLVKSWPADLPSPRIIESPNDVPVESKVTEPARVGVDRLLGALAANRLRDQHQAAIVVDSGTATTVDLVDQHGRFRGGSILPGVRLSALALHDYTARLPLVNADDLQQPDCPGLDTESAIRAGLFWGQLGAIRELSGRLTMKAAELSDNDSSESPLLLLTGGGGRQLASLLPDARWIDSLALHGLAFLADR